MKISTEDCPLLYSFRRCPYAIRARMSLWCAGVQVWVEEISLRDKPKTFLELSPKGTVPVLVSASSDWILEESLDIMKYATRHAEKSLSFRATLDHALLKTNDEIFKPLLDGYKYHERHDRDQNYYREKAQELFLNELEQRLRTSSFLLGNRADFLDLGIFPFVRQFAGVDHNWFSQTMPALTKWLNQWCESRAFKAIMKKIPVGAREQLIGQ